MATHGRGLICAPLTKTRAQELDLSMMQEDGKNSSLFTTPFTISVDLLGHGCTTGISAKDRALTVQALANSTTKPERFLQNLVISSHFEQWMAEFYEEQGTQKQL